ncbi:MAG: hypothetical protein M3N46_13475 [Actinomycetota bacterium]|nr:hypothetical protein [Actinomycetota bacterium]
MSRRDYLVRLVILAVVLVITVPTGLVLLFENNRLASLAILVLALATLVLCGEMLLRGIRPPPDR